jgi:hypothetical protein
MAQTNGIDWIGLDTFSINSFGNIPQTRQAKNSLALLE